MGEPRINLVFEPMPWVQHAACSDTKIAVELFFPERGKNNNIAKAQSVCASCPVRNECFEYGYSNDERGIWGGTTGRERRQLRMKQITMAELSINRGGFHVGRPKQG